MVFLRFLRRIVDQSSVKYCIAMLNTAGLLFKRVDWSFATMCVMNLILEYYIANLIMKELNFFIALFCRVFFYVERISSLLMSYLYHARFRSWCQFILVYNSSSSSLTFTPLWPYFVAGYWVIVWVHSGWVNLHPSDL